MSESMQRRLAIQIGFAERLEAKDKEIDRLTKEIERMRTYCLLAFGESHPEIKKCPHELQTEAITTKLTVAKEALIHAKYSVENDLKQAKKKHDGEYVDAVASRLRKINFALTQIEGEK